MGLFPRSQGDRGKERTEAAACKPTDRGCVCLRDGKGCSRNAQKNRRRNIKEDCFRDGKADFINKRKGEIRLRTRRLSIFLDKIEKICRFQSKISCGLILLWYSINDKNYSVITLIIIVNVSDENDFSSIGRPAEAIFLYIS